MLEDFPSPRHPLFESIYFRELYPRYVCRRTLSSYYEIRMGRGYQPLVWKRRTTYRVQRVRIRETTMSFTSCNFIPKRISVRTKDALYLTPMILVENSFGNRYLLRDRRSSRTHFRRRCPDWPLR